MSSSAESDREERYKHLLQPIRDLAQNWDVDIASSLEDYLEDLEEITITLDGGASKVNFAEAALLIQGSTSVYSRKVEHVYQLVQRTIDFLTQQKQQKANHNHANASKGKNGDDDDIAAGGEEAAFLPLDDIPEGKHIDIGIGIGIGMDMNLSSTRRRNRRRSSVAPNASFHGNGNDNAHIDPGGLSESTKLNAHNDGGDVPDITRPPMFLMEQDYGNSFKMSTCAPQQQSGTLLIEGSMMHDESSLDDSHNNISGASRACDFWRGLGREGDGGLKPLAGAGGMDNDGGGNESDGDDSDGGGDFGGDFGGPEDDFEEGEPRHDAAADGPRTPVGVGFGSTSTSMAMVNSSIMPGGPELRPRASKETSTTKAQAKADTDKSPVDPWAALDPHDPGTSQARPIRKGRTYKLPRQLQLRKRRASKKIQEQQQQQQQQQQQEGSEGGKEQKNEGDSWVGQDGRLMLSVPLLGLAYPEFQYVANREKQRKAAQTRLARRQARVFMGREEFLPESVPSSNRNSLAGLAPVGGMEGVGGGYYDDGYGSGGSYGSDGGGGGGFGDLGNLSDGDGEDGRYEGDGEGYGGADGGGGEDAGVGPISLEDAFRDKPQTYEDLCRSHIEAFMRGTEKYAHETHLSKRVGAWQEKLEPLMESQEKRQAFDIHVYGQSVLSRVASVLTPEQRAKAKAAVKLSEAEPKDKDKVANSSESSAAGWEEEEDVEAEVKGSQPDLPLVDFGVVVAGKERFDVCRLFLASLQLANNGNVRLFHGDNAAEQATTPFQLELLTLQNSDNMSGCFAPTASSASASTSIRGQEDPNQNGAENGAENGAKIGAFTKKEVGSKARGGKSRGKSKGTSRGRSGGRGGVVGTSETPGLIQA